MRNTELEINMNQANKFWNSIRDVFRPYVRGDYADSYYKIEKKLNSDGELESWTKDIFLSLKKFLSSWNTDQNALSVKNSKISNEGDFYKKIFQALLLSTERMNFSTLGKALASLNSASNYLKDLKKESHKIPGGWMLYWLRGNVNASQGKSRKAFQDYSDAIDILRKSKAEAVENIENTNPNDEGYKEIPDIAARMFNDRAIMLFKEGHFEDAADDFWEALSIDPNNPYIRSNFAYLQSGILHQEICLNSSQRGRKSGFQNFDKAYKKFLAYEENSDEEDIGRTGRVYYQFGLLVYRWSRRRESFAKQRTGTVEEKKIERFEECFDNEGYSEDKWRDLFKKAFRNYNKIKDPVRALPALILYLDPLKKNKRDDNLSNWVLWELLNGELGFLSDYFELRKRIKDYLD